MPVLASTITTIIVFFPVTFLFGVSKYLFSALALGVVLALCASYFDSPSHLTVNSPHGDAFPQSQRH